MYIALRNKIILLAQYLYSNLSIYILISLSLHVLLLYSSYFIYFYNSQNNIQATKVVDLDFFVVKRTKNTKNKSAIIKNAVVGLSKHTSKNKKSIASSGKKTSNTKKETTTNVAKIYNKSQNLQGRTKSIQQVTQINTSTTDFFDSISQEDIPLSVEIKEYIQSKIEQCRSFSHLIPSIEHKTIEIVVSIKLNLDGSIKEIIDLYDNALLYVDRHVRSALIRQNRRAIALAAPFDQLSEKDFSKWKQVTLIFKH